MSLRFRLNLLITGLFLLFLVAGSTYAIRNAKDTVRDEVTSVSNLTSRLIEITLSNSYTDNQAELHTYLLEELHKLEATRHLQVAVISRSPDISSPPGIIRTITARAPGWFITLVRPPPVEFRRIVSSGNIPYTEIIILADPSDEITEAWQETKNFLVLLLLFTVVANAVIFILLGRDLAPIDQILTGLDRLERGEYEVKLPKFSSPELSRISGKINHLAGVLLDSRNENRYLTKRTLEIQEQERRLLAHELHDELGQSLSAIKAVATSMDNAEDVKAVQESADVIRKLSDDMYGVARRMIQRLRPTVLDELGLRFAVEELVDGWNSTHSDVFCHLTIDGEFHHLDDTTRINIYRILQESLTNISRHAGARDVSISITVDGNGPARLEISDDGRGFDANSARKGLGLIGIQERVDHMMGKICIDTAPGKGVNISIEIPAGGRIG